MANLDPAKTRWMAGCTRDVRRWQEYDLPPVRIEMWNEKKRKDYRRTRQSSGCRNFVALGSGNVFENRCASLYRASR